MGDADGARVAELTARLDEVKVRIAQAREINRQFAQKQETEASIAAIEKKLTELAGKLKEWTSYREQIVQAMTERIPQSFGAAAAAAGRAATGGTAEGEGAAAAQGRAFGAG